MWRLPQILSNTEAKMSTVEPYLWAAIWNYRHLRESRAICLPRNTCYRLKVIHAIDAFLIAANIFLCNFDLKKSFNSPAKNAAPLKNLTGYAVEKRIGRPKDEVRTLAHYVSKSKDCLSVVSSVLDTASG